jgi:PTH1 family peptidyl-tRNA hydrolase
MPAPLESPFFRLLIGLGNPGREYAETRHNVGFMIADRFAAKGGADFRVEKNWQAALARVGDLHVCKPVTYMNLSGISARAVSDFFKIEPAQILVVLDDMALPLGRLRLRAEGSAGGHNGLASVLEHLGTQAVPRLRIGIGAAQPGTATDHVLGRFGLEEKAALEQSLARAESAVNHALEHGLPAAMNAFNQPQEPTP